MKTKFLLILSIISFFTFSKSQTTEQITLADYPNFYNQTINKLNNIIPNKTNYYNQPLSNFLQVLSQNNLIIKAYDPGPFQDNIIKLMLIGDAETTSTIWRNNYVDPYIKVTFQQSFNFQQSQEIINQHHWFWNPTAENFYKNLIVKKIEFYNVNGITNKNSNPK
ncbi:hypothetical protein CQ046_11740 [Chryseobacterium sp. MYb7]|uniref:hypothetical protein n=1 Tax=Chryseobacterium sp. MYb7 TaxID=1827290 RepID=UPI000D00CE6C|nr:hypothetical protein [Chryseobacterium sp. MYb7]PRB02868.1 hypothetical protein CQ046_11740 [Chryseobacterium sp. MYb7]